MIKGIEHVGLLARNTEYLKEWYVRVFGFRLVLDNGKETFFIMAPDKSMIELIKTNEEGGILGPKISGFRHLAFTVDEFDETVDKLKHEKIEIISEPKTSQDGTKIFFFRDPEGNILQLINRPNVLG